MRIHNPRYLLTSSDIVVRTCDNDTATTTALNAAMRGHLLSVLDGVDATCPVAGFGPPQVSVWIGGHAVDVEWPYLDCDERWHVRLQLGATFCCNEYCATARFVVSDGGSSSMFAAMLESEPMGTTRLLYEPVDMFNRGTFAVFVCKLVQFVCADLCDGFRLRAERAPEVMADRRAASDPFARR